MEKNFTISELKEQAKQILHRSYVKLVVVGLVFGIATASGGGGGGGSRTSDLREKISDGSLSNFDLQVLLAIVAIVISIILAAIVTGSIVNIFIKSPLEVGCRKVTVDVVDNPDASYGLMGYAFTNGYLNIVKIMFLRGLYTFLWSLLFWIPGIIKSYEYRMIPYILADDASISTQEAFARSKEMMYGVKMKAFLMDLSFIGWFLLTGLTCGILGIFYVGPYYNQTCAQLYIQLKGGNTSDYDSASYDYSQGTSDYQADNYYNGSNIDN